MLKNHGGGKAMTGLLRSEE